MAPTVVRDGSFGLFYFSREAPRIHVHVAHPDGEAKFWLTPQVAIAAFGDLSEHQHRRQYQRRNHIRQQGCRHRAIQEHAALAFANRQGIAQLRLGQRPPRGG